MSLSTVEVICAPYEIWCATTGTAFPAIDAAPGAGWTKLGTSGKKSYEERGVTITLSEQINKFKPAGSTANRKAWRIDESVTVAVELADMSAATFAKLLSDATVTQTAAGVGVAGKDSVPLLKGSDVALFACLVRGISPAGADWNADFQLPIVYQEGNLTPVYSHAGPAMLAANLVTLEDDTDGFGHYIVQTADAS